jgi:hypothetical protein
VLAGLEQGAQWLEGASDLTVDGNGAPVVYEFT